MVQQNSTKLNFPLKKWERLEGIKKKCSNWELTERRQTDRQTDRKTEVERAKQFYWIKPWFLKGGI